MLFWQVSLALVDSLEQLGEVPVDCDAPSRSDAVAGVINFLGTIVV